MKSYHNEILSTAAGIGGFGLFFGLFGAEILVSGVGALGLYLGSKLIFSDAPYKRLPQEEQKIIRNTLETLDNLYSLRKDLDDDVLRLKVKKILMITDKILKKIQTDEKLVRKLHSFLTIYLTSTEKILKNFLELSSHDVQYEKIDQTKKKLEELLDVVQVNFEKQFHKILKGDILNLDTEIELLNSLMRGG